MLDVSFLAAFLGGVLALLSPCSALLLPAFFAYAFAGRTELLGRTLLFLAGSSTVFVPLGMGASLVAVLLLEYRDITALLAGLLLIAFGMLELLGSGFALVPPGVLSRFQGQRTASAVFGTGLVYGLAGFCSGPLLGGVLTVAGSAASPLLGGAVLFVYALGTAAPLFVIAYFWDRLNLGRQPWLRGRTLRLAGWTVHTTNLPAGILFVLLGTSFIVFQGSSALSGLYDDLGLAEVGFRLQSWIADHVDRTADVLLGLALALAVTLKWSVRRGKAGRREPVSETISSAPSPIAASDRE